ncbi:amidohydrolase family protein [Demequina oxidasica]|uniref:amidohydrolase family protein n=1 Tax=Demequina oxidasica TaxID=676199 RepID=UPI00078492B5|nr:amidohydrolase family protein [Demequina oxidasica]
MARLHLTGTVVVDAATQHGEAWVVDGRITLTRPVVADATADGDSTGDDSWEEISGVVLPGLVDVHCHIGLDSGGAVDPEIALKQAVVDRDAGTLLIRDAGSPIDNSFVQAHDELPRLIRAGRFIARPKRYLRGYGREIEVADLVRVVVEEARRGDGWVKIIADWIDRETGDLEPLWPAEVLGEAIAAAHALGVRVTAHTFAAESIDPLLDARIDCIEHGTGMNRAQMDRAAAAGVPVVPTLLQVANFEGYAAQGREKFPAYAERMQRMYDNRFAQVRAFREAGLTLLVGTDAGGTIGHGAIAEEAELMVQAGIPAPEVVAAASWSARDFLGAQGLSEGASADFVVYPRDPREDITVLREPSAIVLRGNVVASSGTAT